MNLYLLGTLSSGFRIRNVIWKFFKIDHGRRDGLFVSASSVRKEASDGDAVAGLRSG